MSIQFDLENHCLTLSVRDLCGPEWCGGSVNLLPLGGARSGLGMAVHDSYQTRQEKKHPSYRKEQTLRFATRQDEYSVLIQGRVDGVYEHEHQTVIEEIKSVLHSSERLLPEDLPESYFLQLKIYLYLWSQIYAVENVVGHLVVISPEDIEVGSWEIFPDPATLGEFVRSQLGKIIRECEAKYKLGATRRSQAKRIRFPFPDMRRSQDTMIEAIGSALENQQDLLISAPTGIGKTVAALYSTLRFAVEKGFSIFFLTSKTTQQRIVAETLRLLGGESLLACPTEKDPTTPFNSLVLRSKEKSCANDVVCCHESRCQYAKNFFGKIEHAALRSAFAHVPVITPEMVYEKAVVAEVCPFELSLQLISQVYVTVCDYNYVYDPRVSLDGHSDMDLSRIILIIDEAHNLYSRAREYYSPELDLEKVLALLQKTVSLMNEVEGNSQQSLAWENPNPGFQTTPSKNFLREFSQFLSEIERHVLALGDVFPEIHESAQAVITFDREYFADLRASLEGLMQRYLVYRSRVGDWQEEDLILDFFFTLSRFCHGLELEGDEFVHVFDGSGKAPKLRIICLDPSSQLRKINKKYYAITAMSATLTPLEFYSEVLGFDRNTRTLSLPSPFPPENRKILVVPEVSTTFRQRGKHVSRIAQIIESIVAVRRGNYFAFFPSFDFMDLVAMHLNPPGYELLVQNRVMADHIRNRLLEKLSHRDKAHLVLAVQGGIFAEGVDYPGELAIGAIIIGPGLPKVSLESELMRRYYEEKCSKGFEYAFLYPGMNRVVQSAGRVIRTETDRGIFVLLDRRFSHENYMSLFPRDWYDATPHELVTKDFIQELTVFWNCRDGKAPV